MLPPSHMPNSEDGHILQLTAEPYTTISQGENLRGSVFNWRWSANQRVSQGKFSNHELRLRSECERRCVLFPQRRRALYVDEEWLLV